MKLVNQIACILTVVGALNWGLVGLVNLDLVAAIFGTMSILSRTVYVLVGLSGILVAVNCFKNGGKCC